MQVWLREIFTLILRNLLVIWPVKRNADLFNDFVAEFLFLINTTTGRGYYQQNCRIKHSAQRTVIDFPRIYCEAFFRKRIYLLFADFDRFYRQINWLYFRSKMSVGQNWKDFSPDFYFLNCFSLKGRLAIIIIWLKGVVS